MEVKLVVDEGISEFIKKTLFYDLKLYLAFLIEGDLKKRGVKVEIVFSNGEIILKKGGE